MSMCLNFICMPCSVVMLNDYLKTMCYFQTTIFGGNQDEDHFHTDVQDDVRSTPVKESKGPGKKSSTRNRDIAVPSTSKATPIAGPSQMDNKRVYHEAFTPIELSGSESDVDPREPGQVGRQTQQMSSLTFPRKRNISPRSDKTLMKVMTKAFQKDIEDEVKSDLKELDDVSIFTEHIGRQLRSLKNKEHFLIMQNSIQSAMFKCQMAFCKQGDVNNPIEIDTDKSRADVTKRKVAKDVQQDQEPCQSATTRDMSTDHIYETGSDNVEDTNTDPQPTTKTGDIGNLSKSTPSDHKSATSVTKKPKKKLGTTRTTRMSLRQKAATQSDHLDSPIHPSRDNVIPEDI